MEPAGHSDEDERACELKNSAQDYLNYIGIMGKMMVIIESNPEIMGIYRKLQMLFSKPLDATIPGQISLFNRNMSELVKIQVKKSHQDNAKNLQKIDKPDNPMQVTEVDVRDDDKAVPPLTNQVMEKSDCEELELAIDEVVIDNPIAPTTSGKDPLEMDEEIERQLLEETYALSSLCIEQMTTTLHTKQSRKKKMLDSKKEYRQKYCDAQKHKRKVVNTMCKQLTKKKDAESTIAKNSKIIERLKKKAKISPSNGAIADGFENTSLPIPISILDKSIETEPTKLGSFVASIPLRKLQSNEAAGSSFDTYY